MLLLKINFYLIDVDIDDVMFGNICCCGIYMCICVVIWLVVCCGGVV